MREVEKRRREEVEGIGFSQTLGRDRKRHKRRKYRHLKQ